MARRHFLHDVIESRMCTGCGSCSVLCKAQAITMNINIREGIFLPSLNNEKCTYCGKCQIVCPALDFEHLNKNYPQDVLLGDYKKCYAGYSTDLQVRKKSSSGGLISEILFFLINEKLIDGAIVTKMNHRNPLLPEPFIAKSVDDISLSSGSKYCPVPLNTALRQANDSNNYAYVGLPCHIKGLRKIQSLISLKTELVLGIVCNHTPTLNSIEFVMSTLSVSDKMISKISFRGGGWPGEMLIQLHDGNEIAIPYHSELYWGFIYSWFFWPKRCSVCKDKICSNADISFMDAWHQNYSKDKKGTSFIIVRNDHANYLIKKAVQKGKIYLKEIDPEEIIESQKMNIYYKTVDKRRAYLKTIDSDFRSLFKEGNININIENICFDLNSFIFYLRNSLNNSRKYWPIINNLRKLAVLYKNLKNKLN